MFVYIIIIIPFISDTCEWSSDVDQQARADIMCMLARIFLRKIP